MSHVLYHTACPDCRAKGRDKHGDNLGVYSDGHTYCFSCGASSNATTSAKIHKTEKKQALIPDLPEDITLELSPQAKTWLSKYYTKETDFPLCFWSEQEKKLIFPIMDNKQQVLLAWQYRYFGTNPNHPKWVGYGITESLYHIIPNDVVSKSLVLVEDIISAHKVSKIQQTLCLFGSHVHIRRLANIKLLGYSDIIVWLDWDKKEYAMKVAEQAQMLGIKARVLQTKKDPKEYSDKEIHELLVPYKETI